MPVTVLYLGNFKLIQNLKASVEKRLKGAEFQPISSHPVRAGGAESDEESQKKEEAAEARLNEPLSMAAVKNVLNIVGIPILNLSLVYFLEYACTTSFAERANPKSSEVGDFWHRNAFVLLSFSYQLGVFISRSSFYFFKFPKVWILTYLQVINFFAFFSIAYWRWAEIYYQIPLMIFVGLMGGCSYVNCMFMVLDNKQLSKSQKELAVNVCAFFVDIGIVSAAFFALFIANVVITNK